MLSKFLFFSNLLVFKFLKFQAKESLWESAKDLNNILRLSLGGPVKDYLADRDPHIFIKICKLYST